jgi:DNA-binding XRE family transcriptional regulator
LVSTAQAKRALADRLRELRREKKWSQEKLAEEADMHRTYLAGIERALRNPALENLVKLANPPCSHQRTERPRWKVDCSGSCEPLDPASPVLAPPTRHATISTNHRNGRMALALDNRFVARLRQPPVPSKTPDFYLP